MAQQNAHPSSDINYDPLPLTNDDNIGRGLYNAPPSPGPEASFHTPLISSDLSLEDTTMPSGAAQPRFIGAALYSEGGSGIMRQSYASSVPSAAADRTSEYSSVYALNDTQREGSSPPPIGFENSYRDDPNNMAMSPVGRSSRAGYMEDKRAAYASPRSRGKILLIAGGIAAIVIILAVVIPVYFAVVKNKSNTSDDLTSASGTSSTSSSAGSSSTGTPSVKAAVTGGDGSTVTTEDGSTFTYSNSFGGYWYYDEEDPFNNGARPQSWSPALNETFDYSVDHIRGVNLGGWLTLEPFISPAVFEPYVNLTEPAVDEWTLHIAMAADTANGGLDQIVTHYSTFITEQDFAEIAGAGLNYVRIPLPYWAIETRDGEEFLAKTCWTYFLKAIQWARKYGIRINLDFHALPGSQNGWNHSGRLGTINVLNGPMGLANAQRSLDYIRILAEFISQPEYEDVVTMFGITNEPQGSVVGQDNLASYYLQAYEIVRTAGGTGEGNGPWVGIHDGFFTRSSWNDYFPNADRMTLDSHPYICFNGQSDAAMSTYATTPCTTWGSLVNASMGSFGLSNAGEFSNAVTDCGKWLNGVGLGTRYEGTYTEGTYPRIGDCDTWTDWTAYNSSTKLAIKTFALASMDALQNWFFWTWKIGNSSVTGQVESPAWSYQLGLQQGWMPTDPREAVGQCGNSDPWSPPLEAWQTGGSGAGSIPASISSSLVWPPATISNAAAATLLPSYTPTGVVPTLPGPTTLTASATATISIGDGWTNAKDTAGLMVNISSCTYLDPWIGPSAAPPSPLCS